VITGEVDSDALSVARGRQKNIGGWAKSFRTRRQAEKDAAKKK